MQKIEAALESYEEQTLALGTIAGAAEETFYLAIRQLLATSCEELALPFDVRTGTSERRPGSGRDRPDFVIADGPLIAAYGEVKPPLAEMAQLAMSEERDDQIGRYLARTGIVILSNVKSLGLLLCRPGARAAHSARIPPKDRELVQIVTLWLLSSGA